MWQMSNHGGSGASQQRHQGSVGPFAPLGLASGVDAEEEEEEEDVRGTIPRALLLSMLLRMFGT